MTRCVTVWCATVKANGLRVTTAAVYHAGERVVVVRTFIKDKKGRQSVHWKRRARERWK